MVSVIEIPVSTTRSLIDFEIVQADHLDFNAIKVHLDTSVIARYKFNSRYARQEL